MSRWLAAYALHAGAVQGGGTLVGEILKDGRIIVPFPDRLQSPVATWEEFDFNEGRDMLTIARDIMAAIEAFIDAVLKAFEDARPPRAGPLIADS